MCRNVRIVSVQYQCINCCLFFRTEMYTRVRIYLYTPEYTRTKQHTRLCVCLHTSKLCCLHTARLKQKKHPFTICTTQSAGNVVTVRILMPTSNGYYISGQSDARLPYNMYNSIGRECSYRSESDANIKRLLYLRPERHKVARRSLIRTPIWSYA